MQGLDLTYESLGKSRNEAAIEVLSSALDDANANNRRRALQALMARRECRAPATVLEHWSSLGADEIELLRTRKTWLHAAIEEALGSDRKTAADAMAAAEDLQLMSVLPELILTAESSAARTFRIQACDTVRGLVTLLGNDARSDRDQTTIRFPILARLADSVRRFSMHRNERLVEAFLSCATWSDADLRQLLSDDGMPTQLCKQLLESQQPSVVGLLAGFIRRRNVKQRVSQIIQRRQDSAFRDELLSTIGNEPTQTVLRNLADLGMPECCRGGEELLSQVPADRHGALAHVHVSCSPNYIATLHLIAGIAERGGEAALLSATSALSRCEVPNAESWMRAALHITEEDEPEVRDDETARLLKRLIALLDHPDAALNRSVRDVLCALHTSAMLPHFQSLRPRSRRRLGRVIMKIDPESTARVRDGLRHPVLTKRLEAIAMADGLDLVDELFDSFSHIMREDHQEARIRAAEAMSEATSDATLRLLHEMLSLPECPVRDSAIEAIYRRENGIGQFNARTERAQS